MAREETMADPSLYHLLMGFVAGAIAVVTARWL
jgi:hypothetical protein